MIALSIQGRRSFALLTSTVAQLAQLRSCSSGLRFANLTSVLNRRLFCTAPLGRHMTEIRQDLDNPGVGACVHLESSGSPSRCFARTQKKASTPKHTF